MSPADWKPPDSTSPGSPSGAWPLPSPATAAGAQSLSSVPSDSQRCSCNWRETLAEPSSFFVYVPKQLLCPINVKRVMGQIMKILIEAGLALHNATFVQLFANYKWSSYCCYVTSSPSMDLQHDYVCMEDEIAFQLHHVIRCTTLTSFSLPRFVCVGFLQRGLRHPQLLCNSLLHLKCNRNMQKTLHRLSRHK